MPKKRTSKNKLTPISKDDMDLEKIREEQPRKEQSQEIKKYEKLLKEDMNLQLKSYKNELDKQYKEELQGINIEVEALRARDRNMKLERKEYEIELERLQEELRLASESEKELSEHSKNAMQTLQQQVISLQNSLKLYKPLEEYQALENQLKLSRKNENNLEKSNAKLEKSQGNLLNKFNEQRF